MIRSKSSTSNKLRLLVLGSAWAASVPVSAQELGDGLQAHGFISQTVVHTNDNNVGGGSDDGVAWDLREMGANLSWRPTPDWLISGQALARWAGASDEGNLRLDYGFVDRTLHADGESQFGLRLGKIKNPYGFFNTTRDVAHTRPGIIMPQSIYLDQIRNFFLAAPGAALYGNVDVDTVNWSWQVSMVRPEVNDTTLERFVLLDDFAGHYEGQTSWLGQVSMDMGGRWRAGFSLGEMNMAYRPTSGRHSLPTWVISIEKNTSNWSFTGEYGQSTVKARNYFIPIADHTTEAGYLQVTHRMGNGWQAYARYDAFYLDKNDHSGRDYIANNPGIPIPAHARFAKDWVLGVRHDIDRLALSAEYHRVDGTAWLDHVDNNPLNLVRRWDMILLQAAWRF